MRSAGFTLAEVAVTLVIVSITLVLVLQGLSVAKITAANSHNRKLARELALNTLGRLESGLFWEDLDGDTGSFSGSYAEEGWEDFHWELSIGEELSVQEDAVDETGYFDNYAYRRMRKEEEEDQESEGGDPFGAGSTGGSYERVSIRVTFPKLGEELNEIVLERWIPLDQVYGAEEPQEEAASEDPGEGGSS